MPSHAELLDIHIGDKTMKKMITIVQVISLCAVTLFLTACSSYNTHSSDEAMQESKYQEGYLATEETTIETTIPIIAQTEDVDNSLSEKEYWSCVDEEILGIFKNNDLYVIRVDTRAPYMNYHVEFGVLNSDGTYSPIGISKDECVSKVQAVKDEIMQVLSSYQLEERKSIWSGPLHEIIGLHIYSRFVNTSFTPNTIDRYKVADYQIDLLEFYYGKGDISFIRMDNMDLSPWDKFEIYKSK